MAEPLSFVLSAIFLNSQVRPTKSVIDRRKKFEDNMICHYQSFPKHGSNTSASNSIMYVGSRVSLHESSAQDQEASLPPPYIGRIDPPTSSSMREKTLQSSYTETASRQTASHRTSNPTSNPTSESRSPQLKQFQMLRDGNLKKIKTPVPTVPPKSYQRFATSRMDSVNSQLASIFPSKPQPSPSRLAAARTERYNADLAGLFPSNGATAANGLTLGSARQMMMMPPQYEEIDNEVFEHHMVDVADVGSEGRFVGGRTELDYGLVSGMSFLKVKSFLKSA